MKIRIIVDPEETIRLVKDFIFDEFAEQLDVESVDEIELDNTISSIYAKKKEIKKE